MNVHQSTWVQLNIFPFHSLESRTTNKQPRNKNNNKNKPLHCDCPYLLSKNFNLPSDLLAKWGKIFLDTSVIFSDREQINPGFDHKGCLVDILFGIWTWENWPLLFVWFPYSYELWFSHIPSFLFLPFCYKCTFISFPSSRIPLPSRFSRYWIIWTNQERFL